MVRLAPDKLALVLSAISLFAALDFPPAFARHIDSKAHIFAPYLFMRASGSASTSSLPADQDMVAISRQSGIKIFTLAFIVSSGPTCQAAWFPDLPLSQETNIAAQISRLRKIGGDVILSFGGEAGTELAQSCADVSDLLAQYQAVIDKYKVRMLDFDIESSAILDPASVDRRNQALRILQSKNPDLLISYTLAVLPTGLLPNGIDLLKNAHSHQVTVGNVNLMTMDYNVTSDPSAMGQNAIDAAQATLKQLQSIGIDAPLGLTPMIGMNDVSPQVFTLDDAEKVFRYAKANNRIRRLSMWAVGRDQQCKGPQSVLPDCSGVPQPPFAFSKLFGKF